MLSLAQLLDFSKGSSERIHQPLLILINNFGILLITGYYLANIKNKIFVRKIARSEMPALLLYVDTIFHSVRLNLYFRDFVLT